MSGRAKGKRFVISGKERLDVGLHEDEFLLQAVFYCMGAGPNPDCRAPMLAPRRRQSLIPPPDHANSPAQIPPGGRPCWRHPAGKTLSHRRATPTVRPKSRSAAAHVGAAPPAKPYPTIGPRQQSGPNPAWRAPMLALPRRQSLIPTAGPRQQAAPNPAQRPTMLAPLRWQNLIPPPGHANRPPQIPPGDRPWWRCPAGKTLSHRRATPTVRPKSRPAAAHVGAAPPAKPYPTAGPRQQAGENPARRAPMLALPRRQSLIPPPDHANSLAQILSSGRPCWRGQAPARILFIRKFINQPFSFTS